jgi:hypothetical protein
MSDARLRTRRWRAIEEEVVHECVMRALAARGATLVVSLPARASKDDAGAAPPVPPELVPFVKLVKQGAADAASDAAADSDAASSDSDGSGDGGGARQRGGIGFGAAPVKQRYECTFGFRVVGDPLVPTFSEYDQEDGAETTPLAVLRRSASFRRAVEIEKTALFDEDANAKRAVLRAVASMPAVYLRPLEGVVGALPPLYYSRASMLLNETSVALRPWYKSTLSNAFLTVRDADGDGDDAATKTYADVLTEMQRGVGRDEYWWHVARARIVLLCALRDRVRNRGREPTDLAAHYERLLVPPPPRAPRPSAVKAAARVDSDSDDDGDASDSPLSPPPPPKPRKRKLPAKERDDASDDDDVLEAPKHATFGAPSGFDVSDDDADEDVPRVAAAVAASDAAARPVLHFDPMAEFRRLVQRADREDLRRHTLKFAIRFPK